MRFTPRATRGLFSAAAASRDATRDLCDSYSHHHHYSEGELPRAGDEGLGGGWRAITADTAGVLVSLEPYSFAAVGPGIPACVVPCFPVSLSWVRFILQKRVINNFWSVNIFGHNLQ